MLRNTVAIAGFTGTVCLSYTAIKIKAEMICVGTTLPWQGMAGLRLPVFFPEKL